MSAHDGRESIDPDPRRPMNDTVNDEPFPDEEFYSETRVTAEDAPVRIKCWYCQRMIAVNQMTGGLRYHLWPKDQEPPSSWIIPGEPCPGVGTGVQ